MCHTFFKKEDSKLITYQSGDDGSMIDYLVVRKTYRCLVKDVKVISSEECVPQHHHHCVIKLPSLHVFFAISLKLLRSSNEQGSAIRLYYIMCAVFSVARQHSHLASPSKYTHFCLCSLLHVNHVRSRFRRLHVVHGLLYLFARLSLRLTITLCGVVCNLLSHSLHRMILGEYSAGFTLRKKQFRDSLCRVLSIQTMGLNGFLFGPFHSSTYISPDVGWRNSS